MNDAGFCVAQPCTQTTALSERYSFDGGLVGRCRHPVEPENGADGRADRQRRRPRGGWLRRDGLHALGGAVERRYQRLERAGSAPAPRGFGSATVLADGRVLVVGGCADPLCATVLNDATVYDPVANTWTPQVP
jgi:hypothetical protein